LRDDVPHIGINFDNHPPDFPETLREFLSDMSSVTTPPYTVHDHVALIRMSNPPINGLGHALRKLIFNGVKQALDDPAVAAIVLIGSDTAFSGGADVHEFGTPKATLEPRLQSVLHSVENASKPVIAAIDGLCLGGGLELAMACHFRVATPSAQLAMPEVKLGLLPGGGGTQRLPRLIGLEPALNMILSGNFIAGEKFAGTLLVDKLAHNDLLTDTLDFVATLLKELSPIRRTSQLKIDHPASEAFLQFARTTVGSRKPQLPAPIKCVEAVAASMTHTFEEGLALERELFNSLMNSTESRSLRHLFAAERNAPRIEGLARDLPLRPVEKVAIIGAGTMGTGIAMNFLAAGMLVQLLERDPEALKRGVATIRRLYERDVQKGRLTAQALDRRMALLAPVLDYNDLGEADLLIEAVFEDMKVKGEVFRCLDDVAKPGAILASNTSTLDLNAIAAFTRRPADVVGLHFFSPANVMRLLEIVRASETADDVLATVVSLSKRIKKIAVIAGVCDGFIGNRMMARYNAAAFGLIAEGASPQQLDRALESWGMAMGPCRVGDLAGLDIGWAGRKRRALENPGHDHEVVADRICELGRYGQKKGAGWYRYEAGNRKPIVDPEISAIIEGFRKDKGIKPRKISDREIVERCIYALANEGARLLEEGIAQRAGDIDVVYVNGYGFPRHRGGPMHYIDNMGLPNVVARLEKFASLPGSPGAGADFWQPATLLSRLVGQDRALY